MICLGLFGKRIQYCERICEDGVVWRKTFGEEKCQTKLCGHPWTSSGEHPFSQSWRCLYDFGGWLQAVHLQGLVQIVEKERFQAVYWCNFQQIWDDVLAKALQLLYRMLHAEIDDHTLQGSFFLKSDEEIDWLWQHDSCENGDGRERKGKEEENQCRDSTFPHMLWKMCTLILMDWWLGMMKESQSSLLDISWHAIVTLWQLD
jgi:hypothetical protein